MSWVLLANTNMLWVLLVVYLVQQTTASVHCNTTKGKQQTEAMAWCIPKNYEIQKPPFLYQKPGNHKMNLHFTFSIREISEVKDSSQVLKIPMYFTIKWRDDRLIVDPNHRSWLDNSTGPSGENTEEAETLKHLWRPNLEIYGLEDFKHHKILGEMAGLRITIEKEVKYDIKATIAISCQMDFSQYPFDTHLCTFQVGSYFYDKNSVTCSSEYFDPSRESNFLERNLQHSVEFRNLSNEKSEVTLTSGNYSACGFEVLLRRKHEPLMYQVYIPCILFVTVSWISFIIDPKVVPGRMNLLVILFLVIINVFNNVKSNAPSSASTRLNAIDKFIITCIFSIFSAIIEYALILCILTLSSEKKPGETVYSFEGGENNVKPSFRSRIAWFFEHPRILDGVSIIVFPSFFVFFNIHYWFIASYQQEAIFS